MSKMIYDLDNEGGGHILSDSDTAQPALQVNSNSAGYPAIGIYSTASGSALKITAIQGAAVEITATSGIGVDVNATGGIGIDADQSSTTLAAGDFRSSATIGPALVVGKTVNSSITQAAMKFLGTSVASAALMQFAGGFISCTSITLGDGGSSDYALPVVVGGEIRYIPLFQGSSITGGAKFA